MHSYLKGFFRVTNALRPPTMRANPQLSEGRYVREFVVSEDSPVGGFQSLGRDFLHLILKMRLMMSPRHALK